MSELPHSTPNPEVNPAQPTIEQMAHDIANFDAAYGDHSDLDFHWFMQTFEERYGYPDPRMVFEQQVWRAQSEEWPLTPERMAIDLYHYEKQRQETPENQSAPSFEEQYGYPDPRQQQPGRSDGPSVADQ